MRTIEEVIKEISDNAQYRNGEPTYLFEGYDVEKALCEILEIHKKEKPQGELTEYKPLELDYNVKSAVENLKTAYWSNDTEKYAKAFTEAEQIIVNAICHYGYIVLKIPQGDLKSGEALKAYAREVLCGNNPTNSLLIRMFDEIIDNAQPYELATKLQPNCNNLQQKGGAE